MRLTDNALGRHVYVLGGTGVGKSRALESWIMQLVDDGEGVGVLDPHATLFNNILARIAERRDRRIWERVVIVNPLDPDYAVGFNPLEIRPGEEVRRKARFLAEVITKIWKADPHITARMQRMMQRTFWLLAANNLTLLELEWLLTEPEIREPLLQHRQPTDRLLRYWRRGGEFPTNSRTVTEWTQSTLNKAGAITDDPDIELVFGQQTSTIDFRQIMDEGLILLVNLSKGGVLSTTSHTFGAFIMAQFQQSAFTRADDPTASHRRFTLFLDEFQNYTTDDIEDILTETRKYKLSLTMAHQFYGQLRDNPELQAAVINTVGNLVCFRIGDADAQVFVRDIFQPDLDQERDKHIRYQDVPTIFGEVKRRFEDTVYEPLPNIWEREARKLTTLKDREFWYKERGPSLPQKGKSLEMPDVVMTPYLQDAIDELVALSNERWARPKDELRREIQERQTQLLGLTGEYIATDDQSPIPPVEPL